MYKTVQNVWMYKKGRLLKEKSKQKKEKKIRQK